MENTTIGVFDSGLGGLTAAEELSRLLPHDDIVYFGDTGHIPYGGRPRHELMYMARRNVAFLEGLGARLILAACGTVTSVALDTVSGETGTPLFGVAVPAAEAAARATANGVVGFIATQACIDSGFNQALFKRLLPDGRTIFRACPAFVELIESGESLTHPERLAAAIDEYLRDIRDAGADTLVLGCTHYPLIAGAIAGYMGPDVRLISSSGEAARALYARLAAGRGAADRSHAGRRTYYTSGDAGTFRRLARTLLGREIDGEVISIPPYPLEVAE